MALNLAQRRILTGFQTSYYDGWVKEFQKLTGKEIPVEVNWDEFFHGSDNTDPEYLQKAWKNIFFISLENTFKNLCVDDMGKMAVAEKIKKVMIAPNKDIASAERSCVYADGVLTICHNPRSNDHQIDERTKHWTAAIEKIL